MTDQERITQLEQELAESRRQNHFCDMFYKQIKTWMAPGFNSHCVDAMLCMQLRIDTAKKERDSARQALAESERERERLREAIILHNNCGYPGKCAECHPKHKRACWVLAALAPAQGEGGRDER